MPHLRTLAVSLATTASVILATCTFAQTPSSPTASQPALNPEAQKDKSDPTAKFTAAMSKKLDELADKIQAVELKSASSDAVFGLVGAFFGAIIGAGASLLVLWRTNRFARKRDERAEQQRQEAVRTLVKTEIERNLSMLRDEAERIDEAKRPDDMSGIEWVAVHPCPKWSLVAWTQTAGQFHGALTEDQIRSVQTFYGNLQSYSAAREALSALFTHTQLHKYVSVPHDKAASLLTALLATKNPLG